LKAVAKKMGATKNLEKEIVEEEYKDARMGEYLKTTFGLNTLADKYGAIKNKKLFADRVLEQTIKLEDLSPEIISLCKKMEAFIEETNRL
jgi:hypothetical protein